MDYCIQREIRHTFNAPPDPLFGQDDITVDLPGDSRFFCCVRWPLFNPEFGGIAELYGEPSTHGNRVTQSVKWQILSPIPGSCCAYTLEFVGTIWDTGSGSVLLFQDRDFRGPMLAVDNCHDALAVSGFNGYVSSIVVLSGRWIFYRKDHFDSPYATATNQAIILSRGLYPYVGDVGIANDDMSSLRAIG
jgi:hypothetical protein